MIRCTSNKDIPKSQSRKKKEGGNKKYHKPLLQFTKVQGVPKNGISDFQIKIGYKSNF